MTPEQIVAARALTQEINRFIRKDSEALIIAQEINRLRLNPVTVRMVSHLKQFLVSDRKSKELLKKVFTPVHEDTVFIEMMLFKLIAKFSVDFKDGIPDMEVWAEFISVDECKIFNGIDNLNPKDFEE